MEGYKMITARAMTVFLSAVAAGVAMLGYVQTATAALLRWNLENVTFTDGGAATGFFLLDTQANGEPLADFDIKVTGGKLPVTGFKYPSFEYTPQSSFGSGMAQGFMGASHCCPKQPGAGW
jgi:hypothetical protein